jgi:hypothetical protein
MSLYNGSKLIIIPRIIEVSFNRRKNKISTFPIVMPFVARKDNACTYIHTHIEVNNNNNNNNNNNSVNNCNNKLYQHK